jgi:hypothetical protein
MPQIVHLTDHHLNQMKLDLIHIENYLLGLCYGRKHILNSSVCVFIYKIIKFYIINLDMYCVDQDSELRAVQLFRNLHQEYITSL